MPQPLKVAILWHMHQPDYRDPVSGRTLLPWTYLHAVKDYGEMLRTAAEVPGARMTFNLVPVLLEQLDRYLRGEAQDVWLEAARRDPAGMDLDERRFLLEQFFSVHADRHILPWRRYRELARRRGTGAADPHGFSDQDLRDLQVWFLLAWSGHHLRRQELPGYLLAKGENFSEREKTDLLALYDREVAGATALYRQMEAAGDIEVSVTPYAHPILPLLCGTGIAAEATPGIQLPAAPFRHPQDARLQVRLGLQTVAARLGERPRGMWPAEGAVSEEALRLLREEGAQWAASDEAILAKSLPGGLADRKRLYRPYSFDGLPLLFRDRDLSDRIGFVYAHWEPQKAAADLLGQLRRVAATAPGGTVALILDGENCWERYQENGHPFLLAFYRGLVADPALRAVTVSEALAEAEALPLPRLAPGSWINGNFNIWIGHPEENTAWDWLQRARRDLVQDDEVTQATRTGEVPEALGHLLRAEGSDWFWWFGDDHVTEQADIFDRLFRRHLEAIYRAAGRPVPPHLHQYIKRPVSLQPVREPTALFTPQIDGRISDYFEWLAAGAANLAAGGAMHAAHHEFAVLQWGYDRHSLYLRLDPEEDLPSLAGPTGVLELRLTVADRDCLARLTPATGTLTLHRGGESVAGGRAACGRIVEVAIPLAALQLIPGDQLLFSLHLQQEESEIARWPAEGPVTLPYRGEGLEAEEWFV